MGINSNKGGTFMLRGKTLLLSQTESGSESNSLIEVDTEESLTLMK